MWALSGRLEDPVDDHRVRIRLPVGKHRFLAKTLRSNASAGYPRVISTDKAPALAKAIAELKSEGICPPTVEHRRVKYLK